MSYNDPRSRSLPWSGSLTQAAHDVGHRTGHSPQGLLTLMRAHATTDDCDTLACIPYEHRAALIRWLQTVEPRKPLPKLPWLPEIVAAEKPAPVTPTPVTPKPVTPEAPKPKPRPEPAPKPTQAPGSYRLYAVCPVADGVALTVVIPYEALADWMRQAESGTLTGE